MESLQSLFPTADELLALSPEELAPVLLRLAANHGGSMFQPESVTQITVGTGFTATHDLGYPGHKKGQIETLLNEAWNVLRREGLIIPASGYNGTIGHMVLSREGAAALTDGGFERIKAARDFSKSLLHPAIATEAIAALRRGDFASAVRDAFTIVEVAVREAGGFNNDNYGADLMRRAFNSDTGPLRNPSLPENERKGYEHLFAGAIAAFKNPHSHRKVRIEDVRVAQDQLLLASQLLRIVDAAKNRTG
jgi:uncharacterized protein (TIGR02391 family)